MRRLAATVGTVEMFDNLQAMIRQNKTVSLWIFCAVVSVGFMGCGGESDPDASTDVTIDGVSESGDIDVVDDQDAQIVTDVGDSVGTDVVLLDINEDVGTATGICDFWKQDCVPEMNCYMTSVGFECMEPTGDGEVNDDCEEQTDCGKGLICFEESCALPCSIDELVGDSAIICVDDCEDGFEQVNLDLQIGKCTIYKEIGYWEQILPDNITKEHVFKGIWMSGEDDIHLNGADGIGVHYQGLFWDIVTEGFWNNFNGIWGFAPDDVWGVGIGGQILHYNGVNWTTPGG